MGFLDFLKGEGGAGGASGDKAATSELSAVDYVAWLLKFMLRRSLTELTIDTNRALPGAGESGDEGPPCEPKPEAVINRLKIVSGLNPMRYPSPAKGVFEETRTGYVLVVSTQFEDTDSSSTCKIQLRVRPRSA